MKKVEAETLEEAYQKAAVQLSCSITDIKYEVVQYPSKGIMGFLKKKAIIVATLKAKKIKQSPAKTETLQSEEEIIASEIIATVQAEKEPISTKKIADKNVVLDNFFEPNTQNDQKEGLMYNDLALEIEKNLIELFSHTCFDIDTIEVDVIDNTALIFIDGEDAALLIGKEGYRYNALSYMIFNWLHSKYELFIKLEIAEFFTTQEEMIRNYIKPVIENVEKNGKAKTRFLDGILVQIALEQLRNHFPNKYVAVKSSKEGKKFIVINEFNTSSKHNAS
ncbi:MAG: protein jag [Epsilonproteobacteria bacterium]|nr:MAG: protein jag [Campylobacterota bacterium]